MARTATSIHLIGHAIGYGFKERMFEQFGLDPPSGSNRDSCCLSPPVHWLDRSCDCVRTRSRLCSSCRCDRTAAMLARSSSSRCRECSARQRRHWRFQLRSVRNRLRPLAIGSSLANTVRATAAAAGAGSRARATAARAAPGPRARATAAAAARQGGSDRGGGNWSGCKSSLLGSSGQSSCRSAHSRSSDEGAAVPRPLAALGGSGVGHASWCGRRGCRSGCGRAEADPRGSRATAWCGRRRGAAGGGLCGLWRGARSPQGAGIAPPRGGGRDDRRDGHGVHWSGRGTTEVVAGQPGRPPVARR